MKLGLAQNITRLSINDLLYLTDSLWTGYYDYTGIGFSEDDWNYEYGNSGNVYTIMGSIPNEEKHLKLI